MTVPRVGTITALPTFRVLASMNPFDNVGTARISDSVYDRWCRLAIGYQDAAEEAEIVAVRTGRAGPGSDGDGRLIADAVALTRATRSHPELRRGSSVRGAIDLTAIATELATARVLPRPRADRARRGAARALRTDRRRRGERRDPRGGDHRDLGEPFFLAPRRAAPGIHQLDVDNAIALPASDGRSLVPLRRRPKQLAEAPALYQHGTGAPLVVDVDMGERGNGELTLPAGGQGVLLTRQRASLRDVDELLEDRAPDREVVAMAQRIAGGSRSGGGPASRGPSAGQGSS